MSAETKQSKDLGAPWSVYIVECADGTFYTGIAKDPEKRERNHNSATQGAKYTRHRQPVKLVYTEEYPNHSTAARREHAIKGMSRSRKLALIGRNHLPKQSSFNIPLRRTEGTPPSVLTVDDLKAYATAAEEAFGLKSRTVMESPRRHRDLSRARFAMAAFLDNQYPDYSDNRIAQAMGKDHGTFRNRVNQHEQEMRERAYQVMFTRFFKESIRYRASLQ